MGKFKGSSPDFKFVKHPLLDVDIYVPKEYDFFGNGAEKTKFEKAREWAEGLMKSGAAGKKVVLEPYAGAGVLSLIYASLGYDIVAIEKNPVLYFSLIQNQVTAMMRYNGRYLHYYADNKKVLPLVKSDDPFIRIIDLDPYSSCVPQIREAARILKSGLLFVTAGDIYAGSRFKNWSFTENRYGVRFNGPEEEYPTKVIYKFVEAEFSKRGKTVRLTDSFAFKTMCRICVEVS